LSELKDFNNNSIKDKDGVVLCVRNSCVNALLTPLADDKDEKGEIKLKRRDLARDIHKNDEVDLTSEQIAMIKERSAKIFVTLIYGALVDILEN